MNSVLKIIVLVFMMLARRPLRFLSKHTIKHAPRI